ncbi:MAG TPA: anti-sigma factor [Casimicrobiaceae bacterium]|nr:anti-sigma factor [Casimicrobiaceae bacterium]
MSHSPITEADLEARADGQLSSERAAEVDEEVQRNPAVAARLAELRSQNAWLRAGLDPMLDEDPPQRLVDAAKRPAPDFRGRIASRLGSLLPPHFAPAWAAAATLVIGVAIGWYGRDAVLVRAGMPITFAQQMAYAHVLYASDPNRPVEMWAPDEKRLVAWLSKRLDYPLRAPDLQSAGYTLVGGRLVAGNERPTAMFVYENAAKQRLTLQARKSIGADETAFRYAVADGVGVFYWIDDQCAYALTGELDRAQLLTIGELVYRQLADAGTRR